MTNVRLSGWEIEALAHEALVACGAADIPARAVARATRRAEEDGLPLVGLHYLPTYLHHLKSSRVDGRAIPVVHRPRPGVVVVDAAAGFAHPAFDVGLPALVEAARACGVATMAIRRSYSIGVLGHPVEDIATQGLLALATTNSPANMTAWGPPGKRAKVFGTNPLALAAPRAGRPPLVIDQSSTAVTKVALVVRATARAPIPEGWAFDEDGQPTTDGARALKGSMAPFGGAKGANIALLVEILSAVLAGAALSAEITPYADNEAPPPGVGQFFIAIDPSAQAEGYAERLERLIGLILAGEGTRLPGDRRLAARARAEERGVEVYVGLPNQICAIAGIPSQWRI